MDRPRATLLLVGLVAVAGVLGATPLMDAADDSDDGPTPDPDDDTTERAAVTGGDDATGGDAPDPNPEADGA